MEELYINGQRIYLSDRVISRTLQINDFREIKDRQANYSSNIKIPKTPENIKTFDYLGISGSISTIAYNEISVKYVLDGIEMVVGGKGIIKSVNEFYEFNFYDGNVSLSDLLGNKTLSSLDYTSYNHNLSFSTFFASFTNTSGYVYGLDLNSNNDLNKTSPSFYIHTLFSMIFAQKGWTISGSFFTNTDYLSRLTTMNLGFDQTLTPSLLNKYTQANSDPHSQSDVTPFSISYLVDSYTSLVDDIYKVGFSGNISVSLGTVELDVRVNGVSKGIIRDVLTSITDSVNVYAETSDIITVYAVATSQEVTPTEHEVDFQENFTTLIDVDNSYYSIDFANIIGNTKQIDLVKDVMQRFNLSFKKTRNENNLEFISSEELLTSQISAENFTSKYSRKLSEITKSTYAKQNEFKYLYDNSGNNHANGYIDLTDVNLKETKTLVTSIFKASQRNNDVYSINLWERDGDIFTPIQDGLRIFKIIQSDTVYKYRLKYGEDNYVEIDRTVALLDFSNLSYQLEVDNNYPTFSSLLNTYKLVTMELNLSIVDVYQLDFFKLKYFEQTGRFYYLNKVISFKNNKTTKCELIEIPI